MNHVRLTMLICGALLLGVITSVAPSQAQPPRTQPWSAEAFRLVWQRTDKLVETGAADYSWYWGPEPRSQPMLERDEDSPGGKRLVVYYDKGRMELPVQLASGLSTRQLTFGRLVAEMVSGNVQLGTQRIDAGQPAFIPVAGDIDDPIAPTYAAFARVIANGSVPPAPGARPDQEIDRTGSLINRADLAAAYPETAFDAYDDLLGHNIPGVFSAFMQRPGLVETPEGQQVEQLIDPLAVIGRPLSEAYWAEVELNGTVRPILVQLFERRVLTYNPANPAPFRVEMGNVGLHYFVWRYGGDQPRTSRQEHLLDHFENGDQGLNGSYWFSFDDRGDGGASTASNRLISPGVDGSVRAMRFEHNVKPTIDFSFGALALNLDPGGNPVDLRGFGAIGFWARSSGERYAVRLNSALTDDPLITTFTAPGEWTWVELPLALMQPEPGSAPIDHSQALATANRIEFRPARSPSAGFLDIDNLVLIRGVIATPPEKPGLPMIDNFEDGDLLSVIDTEWFTYNDRDDSGSSVAEITIVEPGAHGSERALRFRGSFYNEWGPAYLGMGVPLAANDQPVDLSDYSGVELSVRTDGQLYKLQMTSALIEGDNQYILVIVAPTEWTTLYIPFNRLVPAQEEQPITWEVARTQIENIIITPLERTEAFQLLIDDVRLVK